MERTARHRKGDEMEKRTYSVSYETKRALASALKQLMAQKPLEKITIQELTGLCGMKRQNFYYHFEDIYDLLRWMFEEEAVPLLKHREGEQLWQEGILQLFQYLQENRAVCLCALRSLGRGHMKRFFSSEIYTVIHRTIETLGQEIGYTKEDEERFLDWMTQIYVTALAGIMENWLLGELDYTPEELVSFVDTILQDQIRGAALRFRTEEQTP